MERRNGQLLVSPSDLMGFLECPHYTTLSLQDLDTPLPRAEDDEQMQLIQRKGDEHEVSYLDGLKEAGNSVAEIEASGLKEAVSDTREALQAGKDIVFQAAFLSQPLTDDHDEPLRLRGHADFLRKVDQPSELGDFSYEAVDTKLATRVKPKFAIQLAFYSKLLAEVQGLTPERAHVALGDGEEVPLHLGDYRHYFESSLQRLLTHIQSRPETRPEPCDYCDLCPWRDICRQRWEDEDHLSFVAGIRRDQIAKLEAAGVTTLAGLATLPEDAKIPNLASGTLETLHHQARLQQQARQTGEPTYELLELDPNGRRGFYRLPATSPGDLFFDMEGDPLEEGGLEYLFGVYYQDEAGEAKFKPFWAHDRDKEREAFEGFMDFVTAQLAVYPEAHIYHYAPYEEIALKRLMSLHGTREAEVDDLLRRGKLVDLYKVVREAVRVSEPSYSIKNLERFYMAKRDSEVADAGASIVAYERYRATGDEQILADIQAYNADDCWSTYLLREWLREICPEGLPVPSALAEEEAGDGNSEQVTEREHRLEEYRRRLLERDSAEPELDELTFQLLDFHRREKKPQWWAIFTRQEATEEELLDDPECLAGLTLQDTYPLKRSTGYVYAFPAQEHKLREGDTAWRTDPPERVGEVVALDEDQGTVTVKSTRELPYRLAIGRGDIVRTEVLEGALFRFADSQIQGDGGYGALKAFLWRYPPTIEGHEPRTPILSSNQPIQSQTAEAIANLRGGYLFIQGPPGSGKTYSGSYVIADLIRRGYRVGVSSNSHKAINNLIEGVEAWSRQWGETFRGVKKASRNNPESEAPEDSAWIETFYDNEKVANTLGAGVDLVAGTAWLFARPEFDKTLDFLFVDEAGQVALANLVAMGTAARNLVLLGDQMQLGQPTQGTHPGRSGESALDYLLDGRATIEADRGIFLPVTYRMHPSITGFISEAIYEGRLESAPRLESQGLENTESLPPPLKEAGIATLEVTSEGCSQRCEAEAEAIATQYQALMGRGFRDTNGQRGELGPKDILVVAPYNMQVNLLQDRLGPEARVGTVDKFQGQEAEVVLVSMTTSSEADLPRYLDFLFSRNRLNVAISRARILAVVAMNPRLTSVSCKTLEQMALVNTLCHIRFFANRK